MSWAAPHKVYGGISAGEASNSRLAARASTENRDIAVEAKRAEITEKAASLIRDGNSLIVHAGSTCYQLGTLLAHRNLRIWTNSMPLAAYLGERGTCHLSVAGGDLYREPGIIHDAHWAARQLFASRLFPWCPGHRCQWRA